ncbi:MAG TPA: aminoglycoside phosphotransferase family protein [Thermoplasmata archaeon]|nr:aminoglycoside phosphotransferase family protein [Thermoplasmata archaeon]
MISSLPPAPVVARSVRASWPGPPVRRLVVRETGWTNLVFEADQRWIIRIPRRRAGAESLDRELRVLEFLSDRLRAGIPRPLVVGTLDAPDGWPFMVYERLRGRPIANVRAMGRRSRERLGLFLEDLLTDLAAVPVDPLLALGVDPGRPADLVASFRRLRSRYRRRARSRMPPSVRSGLDRAFEDLLSTLAVSRFQPVVAHNDLWPNHIIWDESRDRATGVIDWEDTRVGDPATDLVMLSDLDPDLWDRLRDLRRRGSDRQFDARLGLYRKVLPIHGYLYGLESGDARLAADHLHALASRLRAPTRSRHGGRLRGGVGLPVRGSLSSTERAARSSGPALSRRSSTRTLDSTRSPNPT